MIKFIFFQNLEEVLVWKEEKIIFLKNWYFPTPGDGVVEKTDRKEQEGQQRGPPPAPLPSACFPWCPLGALPPLRGDLASCPARCGNKGMEGMTAGIQPERCARCLAWLQRVHVNQGPARYWEELEVPEGRWLAEAQGQSAEAAMQRDFKTSKWLALWTLVLDVKATPHGPREHFYLQHRKRTSPAVYIRWQLDPSEASWMRNLGFSWIH